MQYKRWYEIQWKLRLNLVLLLLLLLFNVMVCDEICVFSVFFWGDIFSLCFV
jgi:hypothetical protein